MKNNKTALIAVACAIGSAIGTLSCFALAKYGMNKYWYLGLIIGGIVGYVIYDIKHVIKMIPQAWHSLRHDEGTHKALKIATGVLSICALFLGFLAFYELILEHYFNSGALSIPALLCLLTVEIAVLFAPHKDMNLLFGKTIGGFINECGGKYTSHLTLRTVLYYFVGFLASPLLMLILVLNQFRLIAFILKFAWKLVKLIHSDDRLLVGISSVIGAWVGYLTKNMLIGMLIGAIAGVTYCKIASLLRTSILKLKPKL